MKDIFKMKNILKTLGMLFAVNFRISAFTFGGGYVVIPMMDKNFVHKRKCMTEDELMDIAAISQSVPGAIAVNMASLVGYKIAGLRGAIVSCVGSVMPPVIILGIISGCYEAFRDHLWISAALRGMEAGVAAVVVDLVITMSQGIFRSSEKNYFWMVPCAFCGAFIFGINVFYILIGAAAASLGMCFWNTRKRSDDLGRSE